MQNNNKTKGNKMADEKEVKPGVKTTEFFITVLSMVFGALVAGGVVTGDQSNEFMQTIEKLAGLLAVIIPQVGYAISRGIAKK